MLTQPLECARPRAQQGGPKSGTDENRQSFEHPDVAAAADGSHSETMVASRCARQLALTHFFGAPDNFAQQDFVFGRKTVPAKIPFGKAQPHGS